MIRNYLTYMCLAQLLALSAFSTARAAGSLPEKPQTASISLGAEYATGSYGTDSTIRSVYMPLIVTWSPNERFDIGIEIPYLYQSSSSVTTSLFSNSQSATTSQTVLRGGPGGTSQQQLAGNASVSGGSGSSVSGLGTGEFDFGSGLEATKWFGNLHLSGEGFYTYQGKADGFGLKNYFSFTTAVGYQLTNAIEPMLVIKGATAPSSYSGGLLEARARIIWALTDTTSLDLYGSRGIADSSPEYGGGLSVIYAF